MYRPVLSRGKDKGGNQDNEDPESRASYAIKHSNQNNTTIDHSQVLLLLVTVALNCLSST